MKKESNYGYWFNWLYVGVEIVKKELCGKTDVHSLIKVVFKGSYTRWGGSKTSPKTEWMVVTNGDIIREDYGFPNKVWNKEGRLLNSDKEYILKKYKIEFQSQQ